jgi:hypothetical protein
MSGSRASAWDFENGSFSFFRTGMTKLKFSRINKRYPEIKGQDN